MAEGCPVRMKKGRGDEPTAQQEQPPVATGSSATPTILPDGGGEATCLRCGASVDKRVRFCMDCRTDDDPANYPAVDPDPVTGTQSTEGTDTSDEDRTLRRRTILVAGSVSVLGAGVLLSDQITATLNDIIHGVGRYWRDFHLSEVGLEDFSWEGDTLVLTFDPDHDADGWGIVLEGDDPFERNIVMGTTAVDGAVLELPFRTVLEEHDREFADRSFEFVAYEGSFTDWSLEIDDHDPVDVVETLVFDPPDEALPE